MNGKKYKVTIRVEDHPPRYCDQWKKQQKMSSDDRDTSKSQTHSARVENKPVYRSCVTLHVPDKREHLRKDINRDTVVAPQCISEEAGASGRTANSNLEGKSEGDTDCPWLWNGKPLETKSKSLTSLNIYKLQRSNAIDGEELCDTESLLPGEDTDKHTAPLRDTTEISTTHRKTDLCLNNEQATKSNFGLTRNGCNVLLPIVVLNSESSCKKFGQSFLQMNATTNCTGDDELSSDCFDIRPPLNREGSACSSDSIITEIEALTDDESEVKSNQNVQDEQRSEKCNSNWKKIRGMIHWTPFAKNYKKKYPWVQLAGHQGNFKAGESGTILKRTNDVEKECLIKLMKDVLRPYVPEFKREVENHEERYLVMQDLLCGFECPSVMDCKMGVRTFLEDELVKARKQPKLRNDLYQKMIDVDPNAPTEEEHKAEGITKPRYMKWREELSSSASLGFRIEGIKKSGEKPNKDFKTTRSKDEVGDVFRDFIGNDVNIKLKYIQRLKAIRGILESSSFFKIHEVIGSSLLFVHDSQGSVNVWMIDFAKTRKVQDGIQLNHRDKWTEGNQEDGYLFGLDNMLSIWSNL